MRIREPFFKRDYMYISMCIVPEVLSAKGLRTGTLHNGNSVMNYRKFGGLS